MGFIPGAAAIIINRGVRKKISYHNGIVQFSGKMLNHKLYAQEVSPPTPVVPWCDKLRTGYPGWRDGAKAIKIYDRILYLASFRKVWIQTLHPDARDGIRTQELLRD